MHVDNQVCTLIIKNSGLELTQLLMLNTMMQVLVIIVFCRDALDISSDIKFLFVLLYHPKL